MLLGLYVGSLLFGAVLVGSSIVFGGQDLDTDVGGDVDLDVGGDVDLDVGGDVDLDVGGDMDLDADHGAGAHDLVDLAKSGLTEGSADWVWLPFLSLRFWAFGASAFGATGTLLSLLSFGDWVTAPVAGGTGLVVGTGASWLFRQLSRETVSGEVSLRRYVGEEARVVLGIRPGAVGQIRLETAAGDVVLVARTRDKHPISTGDTVLIASIEGRTAQVTRLVTEAFTAPPSTPG